MIKEINNKCLTSCEMSVTDLFPPCSVELSVLYKEVFNIIAVISPLHPNSQIA